MKRKGIIIVLLLIAAIVITWVAVGWGKSSEEVNSIEIEKEENGMKKGIDKVQKFDPNKSSKKGTASNLSFTLVEAEDSTAENKQFKYTVTNEGTSNEKLSFTTSQTYEYELSSKEHGFIKRYSDGKSFLQVLKDITLLPQEEISYIISLPSLEKGSYTLTVNLVARGMDGSSKTLLFTVE